MPKQHLENPGDGFKLLGAQNSQYRQRSMWLRAWRDGDDTKCAVTRKARGVPCDPPVAVVLVRYTSHSLRRPSSIGGRRRALCPLHLPFANGAAELVRVAHQAAHDRLAQAHPDEFERYLDDEVRRRRKTATGQATRELAHFLGDDTEGTR